MALLRLDEMMLLENLFLTPRLKKIFPYTKDNTKITGLVQQPDKIVDRYRDHDLSLFVQLQFLNSYL